MIIQNGAGEKAIIRQSAAQKEVEVKLALFLSYLVYGLNYIQRPIVMLNALHCI